ncbi:hypothetical protein NQ318_021221 [Aromia moschata]|uniref:WDHD1 first WD40 domain-containing protein n=1 Tax=Aromia moschata TaxID=1265417 RepID=A0AAV8X1Z6_9CUCU|nr:hypothetical protein NQ318_021221 [Aromia moschata]
MSMVHEPLRYAHDEGHTDVCYTEDGSKFITCGADGDIRIWSSEENEDPIHNCIGEWALSVRQRGNNVYVATSSNDIQILTLPDGDRDGVLDRFVAPINHIAVGKNSNLIALAGEDMEVKLINLERMNKEIKVLSGLSGPCLSVAICPNSKMIAASSGDSKLRIWDIESTNLLKEIACFPKVNSFANAKILGRIDFDPIKGIHLAYPDKSNIVILNTDDWSQHATLNCDVTAMYSIVQYSPCGNYIAATSEEGDFVVWDASSQMVINRSKHPKSVSIGGLMWNPKESMDQHSVNEENNDNEDVFENINFEDDDDEDNENAISVEKLKRQHMESPSL